MDVIDVVAALIWENGRFLICHRPPHKARGGLWEFVGGKVEPGESREQALVRECREEMAVTVAVGTPFTEVVHAYPDLTVRLCLFRCQIAAGSPQLLEHTALRWITPEEIPQYDFCPADETILKMIRLEADIRMALEAQVDADYQAFQARLLPTVPPEKILGVRTPVLRKMAQSLRRQPEGCLYADILTHNSFDETQLHSFLISSETDYPTALAKVERFLPAVDNWAVCDQLSPKAFAKEPSLRQICYDWMCSSLPYTVRFGIGMLMRHFLDGQFDPEDPARVAAVHSEEYYVHMMVAWYFATALAKQPETVLPYFERHSLPERTHRKAIQKAIESDRIGAETKEYLRSLR